MVVTISVTPAARQMAPAASRPAAIPVRAGSLAAMFTLTLTGREPSAFITTIVQFPLLTGHIRAGAPELWAAQGAARVGGFAGAAPATSTDTPLVPAALRTVVRATPVR